jgi:hypothetical protein
MSIQEVSAEKLAELFHHYHQALAPDFGGATDSGLRRWDEVPPYEKNRVIAAARLALLEVAAMRKNHVGRCASACRRLRNLHALFRSTL